MNHNYPIYLGLGANLGDRIVALRSCIARLSEVAVIERVSSAWDTAPQILEDQPRFLNAAVSGRTHLDPFALLRALKSLETELGRLPSRRYGPRAIDIDVLLYDAWQVESRELVIPHPLLPERAFALAPLSEIAPDLRHPRLGLTIRELLARTPRGDIVRLDIALTR